MPLTPCWTEAEAALGLCSAASLSERPSSGGGQARKRLCTSASRERIKKEGARKGEKLSLAVTDTAESE